MILVACLSQKFESEFLRRDTKRGTDQTGEMFMSELNPAQIMQVGMGFFASKTLLSAVELALFTTLAAGPMTGREIAVPIPLSIPLKIKL